jgi:hypothetical protein
LPLSAFHRPRATHFLFGSFITAVCLDRWFTQVMGLESKKLCRGISIGQIRSRLCKTCNISSIDVVPATKVRASTSEACSEHRPWTPYVQARPRTIGFMSFATLPQHQFQLGLLGFIVEVTVRSFTPPPQIQRTAWTSSNISSNPSSKPKFAIANIATDVAFVHIISTTITTGNRIGR